MTKLQDRELRCPARPEGLGRLFGKVYHDPDTRVVAPNLLEFDCRDCRRRTGYSHVFHIWNAMGEFIETRREP